jgi:hypothetical protein
MTLALFLMQIPMDSDIETWKKSRKQVLCGWDVRHVGGSIAYVVQAEGKYHRGRFLMS